MPVYLLHGFRWPRPLIRIHIILQNLDDAASEWLVAPATSTALLNNFVENYPDPMSHLRGLRFVEQYDSTDTTSGSRSQPYAYVADVCEEIKLGVDVDEVRGKGVPNDQWAAVMELRDRIAPEEKVAWFVVVCGDEERWAPGLSDTSLSNQADSSAGVASLEGSDDDESEEHSPADRREAPPSNADTTDQEPQQPKGLKKLFSSLGIRKSRSNLGSVDSIPSTLRRAPNSSSPEDTHSIVDESQPQKYSVPNSSLSNSSSDKSPASPSDSTFRKSPPAQQDNASRRQAMPKLQTSDLAARSSHLAMNSYSASAMVQSPGALSLIPDTEDQEIITGPIDEEEEDDLAAPAPTVKHGKQQDLVSRQRKRTSIASFTGLRATSPDTLRNISPIVRAHPQSFGSAHPSSSELSSLGHTHQLQKELLPDEIDEPTPRAKQPSPPASYVPSGAPPSIIGSVHTSRSSSPVKIASRQQSYSRLSALNALEGNSPPRRNAAATRGAGRNSRRSSMQQAATSPIHAHARSSQYSSMSGTMAALYGNHEKDFRKRQSVTQEDLLAKGLDNMDFSTLR